MIGYFLILITAIIWFSFICILLWSGQTSKARIQQRFLKLIEESETSNEFSVVQQSNAEIREESTIQQNIAEKPFTERVFVPIFNSLSMSLSKLAPAELRSMLETQIFRMGKQDSWSVVHLASCWVLSVGAGIFIAFMMTKNNPDLQYQQVFMFFLLGAVIGALLPFFILQSIIRNRKEDLRRQMPDFIDLICISVQAGLSFDGAVSKITNRMKGVLSEEFQRMQRDIRNGMTRQRSLTQMAKRCDIEEMYLFTSSVIQADRLGTSMSRTLKMQADNIRDRYRQSRRAEVMKAPIKIIFPIILFIFPSIFVVTLFPFLISFINSFGK